ncbi:MAG: methyltransferase domain-containing protein [Rhodospirillales bacterium]|nr:methyltransferase domain-containing protein [Rhodospirillales bacterium]
MTTSPSSVASGRSVRKCSTLGPVADLEKHLPAEWWRELFNSIYLKTDGDVVENNLNTDREVSDLIVAADIRRKDRLLDLCCGQGRHSLELAGRGFSNVTGVDRSRYLIRLAKRRASKRGLNVTFKEGDARALRFPENSFDCVFLMGNSFGYFDQETDDHRVIDVIKKVLCTDGQIALDITDGDWMRGNFEPRSWEWIDQNHFVCRERSLSSDDQRLITREVVTHAERGVIADQFYAERLYSRESIERLLEAKGFRDLVFHASFKGESNRNGDLGMMAHRIFLTANAPHKAASKPRGETRPLKVTVVMGDPHMPDQVKKNGQFNPEDMETIDIFKKSVLEIDGYIFDYLDDHKTIKSSLGTNKSDFVFNLCDEGLNNDPFMELHVPALLESYGVPYTGAGPACLGMCYDKSLVRAVAMANDIPVPLETYIGASDYAANLPSIFPAILKPVFGDSSIGITKDAVVDSAEGLVAYLEKLREILPGQPVLIQEFLFGPEYSVALLGNPGQDLKALPILEVDYGNLPEGLPRILGYESKWLPDSPYWNDIKYHETRLDSESQRSLVAYSRTLFERLRCQDYARFDFRTDARGEIKLLEVNPNPGWCWDGKMNLMAGFDGMSYTDFLRNILEAARERLSIKAFPPKQSQEHVA